MPFNVSDEEFKKVFVLVDGIYPRYSRFVRGISEPITEIEKNYTGWQEAARKDIERAFGVLQCKFQWIDRPFQLHDMKGIAKRVATCLVLHNICVADRVIGDPRANYNPAESIVLEDIVVDTPEDLQEVQQQQEQQEEEPVEVGVRSHIGIRNSPLLVQRLVLSQKEEWQDLDNMFEHDRLMKALMIQKSGWKRK